MALKKEKKNRSFIQRFCRALRNIILIPLILIVITFLVLCGLTYFRVFQISAIEDLLYRLNIEYDPLSGKDSNALLDEYMLEPIDVDSYYEEYADVVSITSVEDSSIALGESSARELLDRRGFSSLPLSTEYTIDGQYSGTQLIENFSDNKHPIYESSFVSDQGIYWNLTLVGNCLMAVPIFNGTENVIDSSIIISESETVLSYDSSSNCFYELAMKSEEYLVNTVSEINYKLLNSLSVEEIMQHD